MPYHLHVFARENFSRIRTTSSADARVSTRRLSKLPTARTHEVDPALPPPLRKHCPVLSSQIGLGWSAAGATCLPRLPPRPAQQHRHTPKWSQPPKCSVRASALHPPKQTETRSRTTTPFSEWRPVILSSDHRLRATSTWRETQRGLRASPRPAVHAVEPTNSADDRMAELAEVLRVRLPTRKYREAKAGLFQRLAYSRRPHHRSSTARRRKKVEAVRQARRPRKKQGSLSAPVMRRRARRTERSRNEWKPKGLRRPKRQVRSLGSEGARSSSCSSRFVPEVCSLDPMAMTRRTLESSLTVVHAATETLPTKKESSRDHFERNERR